MFKRFTLGFVFLALVTLNSYSQILVNKYVFAPFGSPSSEFEWSESVIDSQGDIITVGHNVINATNIAIYVNKVSSSGTAIWSQNYQPSGATSSSNYGIRIILDNNDNIYVAGASLVGTAEMFNYVILKYNSSGTLQWSQTYNGPDNLDDYPTAMALNSAGDLFVTGASKSTNNGADHALLKLNSTFGTIAWTKRHDYLNLDDVPSAISLDGNDNPVVAGLSEAPADTSKYTTIKYDKVSGNPLVENFYTADSVSLYSAPVFTKDMDDNFYLAASYLKTGEGKNLKLIKLDSNLDTIWTTMYDRYGFDERANSIRVAGDGDIYVSGSSENLAGNKDLSVMKYDSTGTLIWKYFRQGERDGVQVEGYRSILNSNEELIVAGSGKSSTESYLFVTKLDTLGKVVWEKKHNTSPSGTIRPTSVILKTDPHIFITSTIDDSTTTKYSTIKLEEYDRGTEYEFHDSIPIYKKDQLIVRFNPEVVIKANVDKLDILYGEPAFFLNQTALSEIGRLVDLRSTKLIRIFKQIKTTDTISTSRLNESVVIPELWATFVMQVPTSTDLADLVADLQAIPSVVMYAHPNFVGHYLSCVEPNDNVAVSGDSFDGIKGFNLYDPSGSGPYPDAHINMLEAWCIETGKEHIRVGFFDSVLDFKHPDFGYDGELINSSKILKGWYFGSGGYDMFSVNDPDSHSPHGTAVAGIAGALTNNRLDPVLNGFEGRSAIPGIAGGWYEEGASGENRGASLYSLGIMDASNGTLISVDLEYVADAIFTSVLDNEFLDYGYGLQIMNHSWAIQPFFNDLSPSHPNYGIFNESNIALLKDVTYFANRNHVTFVAGRGNGDETAHETDITGLAFQYLWEDPAYPACYNDDWVINVGGTGHNGNYCSRYNGGNTYEPSIGLNIDIGAPAARTLIVTTNRLLFPPTGGYFYDSRFRGTSAAAGHVTGVAALILSYANSSNNNDNDNLAPEDVEFILQESAKYKMVPSGATLQTTDNGIENAYTGHGLMDAGAALKLIEKPCKNVRHFDSDNSTSTISSPTLVQADVTVDLNEQPLYYGQPSSTPLEVPGTYLVDVYKITGTVTHNLPAGESKEFLWTRSSSSTLFGPLVNGEIVPYEDITLVSETGNQVEFEGYCFKIKSMTGVLQRWLPFDPFSTVANPKFAYTVLTNSCSTNTEENQEQFADVLVYPNPSSHEVSIEINNLAPTQNLVIECIDALGREVTEVYNGPVVGNQFICSHKVTELNGGVYFYIFKVDNEIISSKSFVKN